MKKESVADDKDGRVLVGTYKLGLIWCRVYLDGIESGYAGRVECAGKDKGTTAIFITVNDEVSRADILDSLLHEAIEVLLHFRDLGYMSTGRAGTTSGYVFMMTHVQFQGVITDASGFLNTCLEDVLSAYTTWRERRGV